MSRSRARLHSLGIASALRETFQEGYHRQDFGRDLMAGVTVG